MNEKATGTALARAEETALAVTAETVKRYINAKATDQEITLFLNQCVMFGLNPFKREIYLIKYSEKDRATFVVGYETYLKRAERSGKWSGMASGTEDDKSGALLKAWVDIYRKDWPNPLHHEVYLSEYIQLKDEWANGQPTGKKTANKFWAEKPRTMLKKVAIAQAMRMAFPDELAGMPYIQEEAENDDLPGAASLLSTSAKAEYEALKKRPLPNVRDEFSGAPAATEPEAARPDVDLVAEAEAAAAEVPETDLAKLNDAVGELSEFVSTDIIAGGIKKKMLEKFNAKIDGLKDLTAEQITWTLGYIKRWAKAVEAERSAALKAGAR